MCRARVASSGFTGELSLELPARSAFRLLGAGANVGPGLRLSYDSRAKQIVHVHGTEQGARAIDDDQLRDFRCGLHEHDAVGR